jgi:hypothetical protein
VHVASFPQGEAIPGASVRVSALNAPAWPDGFEATTNERGIVQLEVPRYGGPLRVEARALGYVRRHGRAAPGGMYSIGLWSLGEARHRVRVRLVGSEDRALGPEAFPDDGTIEVRQHGMEGEDAFYESLSVPVADAVRDGIALPAGRTRFALRARGWAADWQEIEVPRVLEVVLGAARASLPVWRGRVLDVNSDAPVEGAVVRYEGWGRGEATTDAMGRFFFPEISMADSTFVPGLDLTWSAPGYLRAPHALKPAGPSEGDPASAPGWTLPVHRVERRTVRVTDPHGEPVTDGVAWLRGAAMGDSAAAVTEEGTVEIAVPLDATVPSRGVFVASRRGVQWLGAEEARAAEAVQLRPWRMVRGEIRAPGYDELEERTAFLHLADPQARVLRPEALADPLWTVPIGASGRLALLVPDGEDVLVELRFGGRLAVYRAADLMGEEARTLVLSSRAVVDQRGAFLASPAQQLLAGVTIRLRYRPREEDPRPLDLVYEVTSDEGGMILFDGPSGPYDVYRVVDGESRYVTGRVRFGLDDWTIVIGADD